MVASVRKQGAVLGVYARSVKDPLPGAPAVASSTGVLVLGMDAKSPVASSGLKAGDVILRLDGRPVDTLAQLQMEMLTKQPGETVVLDVLRNSQMLRIPVTTRSLPQ